MKKILLFLYCFICSTTVFTQTNNDYRTIASGNWTNPAIWEIFDGGSSSWIPATNFPGDIAGTNDVVIGNGVTVTLNDNTNITEFINSVTLGDETGSIDTILITNTSSINTGSFTIAYDGFLNWTVNKSFILPANTPFLVESPNPDPLLELGIDHGINEQSSACSAAKILQIGTIKYATCNGSGGRGVISFEVVNDGGGNLTANATSTPSTLCANNPIQLNVTAGGTETDQTPLTYNWIATSPIGYSFSANTQNPTDTPTTPGTYTYQITITNSQGLPATSETTVEVQNCTTTIVTNRNITFRVNK